MWASALEIGNQRAKVWAWASEINTEDPHFSIGGFGFSSKWSKGCLDLVRGNRSDRIKMGASNIYIYIYTRTLCPPKAGHKATAKKNINRIRSCKFLPGADSTNVRYISKPTCMFSSGGTLESCKTVLRRPLAARPREPWGNRISEGVDALMAAFGRRPKRHQGLKYIHIYIYIYI